MNLTNLTFKEKHDLAYDDDALPEMLALLSQDQNEIIRQIVAKNRNTPSGILEELATDSDREVRVRVLSNKNVSVKILHILSKDEDPLLRYYVAKHKMVTREILDKLSCDNDEIVRKMAELQMKNESMTKMLKKATLPF